jgi:hypothetical protein
MQGRLSRQFWWVWLLNFYAGLWVSSDLSFLRLTKLYLFDSKWVIPTLHAMSHAMVSRLAIGHRDRNTRWLSSQVPTPPLPTPRLQPPG